jgi:hypothetical protein
MDATIITIATDFAKFFIRTLLLWFKPATAPNYLWLIQGIRQALETP